MNAEQINLPELDCIDFPFLSGLSLKNMAKKTAGMPGVYLFISGENVLYVGESTNIYARAINHSKAIEFRKNNCDKFAYIVTDEDERHDLEKELIKKFSPKLNYQHNPNNKRKSRLMYKILNKDNELRQLVEIWNTLSQNTKQAILQLTQETQP